MSGWPHRTFLPQYECRKYFEQTITQGLVYESRGRGQNLCISPFHDVQSLTLRHAGPPLTLITVCISSYFLHCHSLVVGDRGVGATECLCNFTLERKRQHRQTSEHPKSPFYISVSERGDPTHCQALQREQKKKNSKPRLSFHTITISLWKALSWSSNT